ncbi:hypothetical protein [Polaribacter sp.]|uniref:hypothetical protein n=1 Tax=Polaribacter sp. TaxID=1920175 RepID=UPI0025DAD55A|nr:hypothetical protein [Polaribacter sp.]
MIPPNTTAEIHLPKGALKSKLSINGKSIDELSNIKLIETKDKIVILSVKSGTYNITTKLNSYE